MKRIFWKFVTIIKVDLLDLPLLREEKYFNKICCLEKTLDLLTKHNIDLMSALSKNKDFVNENSDLKIKINFLESEIDFLRKSKIDLFDKLSIEKKLSENLKKEIKAKEEKKSLLENEINSLKTEQLNKTENIKLLKQLKSSQDYIKKLKNEKLTLEKRISFFDKEQKIKNFHKKFPK